MFMNNTKFNRVILIVLDGVGIGEAPDASLYGDVGSNSLANTAKVIGGLHLPNFGDLGLGNIFPIQGIPARKETLGAYGKMQPKSAGKDTISGHWELMGIHLQNPLPTYPSGFPPEVIEDFKQRIGKGILGNIHASGTEIIQELGMEHIQSGKPIVYTSADSVFQIAAHEDIIPIDELYALCEIAREILAGDHAVGRVIARPFIGTNAGEFTRTERRKDYPLRPPDVTTLDRLVIAGKEVRSVGKIDDIFGYRGITHSKHTLNNADSLIATQEYLTESFEGLLFVNLIEFDMIYGHRNDPVGYANALQKVDEAIPIIQNLMNPSDLCMFVSDHGVDPTTPSTDHSREFSPLLVFGNNVRKNTNLGSRETFADVGATIAEIFDLEQSNFGKSFLDILT